MMKILNGMTLAVLLIAAAYPSAVAAAGGGEYTSCSIRCTIGGGCRASGLAPCTCDCRGLFGFGGPQCSCGGGLIDNPAGD